MSPALLYWSTFRDLNQLMARRVVDLARREWPLPQPAGFAQSQPASARPRLPRRRVFSKCQGGEEPLDVTWIHPESYEPARKILNRFRSRATTSNPPKVERWNRCKKNSAIFKPEPLAAELEIGILTCRDIFAALARPGLDPRAELPGVIFRQGILKLEDLEPGMQLKGTVFNVVDFGAFVDVGLKDSGLVHISQLANRFVNSPHEVVSVGDVVTVWVLEVDLNRRRVSLTMLPPNL